MTGENVYMAMTLRLINQICKAKIALGCEKHRSALGNNIWSNYKNKKNDVHISMAMDLKIR